MASGIGDKLGGVVDWKGKEYAKALRKASAAGLRKASRAEVTRLRGKLSGTSPSSEGSPPGKESGRLARSIGARVRTTTTGASATIGVLGDTEVMAYAARLAGGFVGRDSRGRYYSQAPRPWLDLDAPAVFAACVSEMQKASV